MAEIYQLPENGGNTGTGSIPFSIPIGGIGGNSGLFGNGNNTIGELIGLAIVASIFGWGGNGFGNGFGGNNAGAGFISNQLNNDSGRQLIMQAVTNQGEASRSAISSLSTMIGQDFNLVNGAIQNIQNALNTIGANQGMNALQVINAIQSGNAAISAQFAQCCCENRLASANEINAMNQGFAGVQQNIAAKSAADQLAMCQQTYNLTDTMNRNYLALDNKIDAMESARKDRELLAKDAEIATLKSQNFTTAALGQAIAPLIAQLNAIGQEVEAIKRCQPATITLPNNQYIAVPTLLANAGSDFIASYWANRLSAATTTTPTGGTTTQAA